MNKICTDIEQSKKLIELGIDRNTADMYWFNRHINLTETKYELFVVDKSDKHIDFFNSYSVAVDNNEIIPAWSLAALLDILKYPSLTQDVENKWSIMDWTGAYPKSEYGFDNSIDACYEMIMRLHELNLL